MKNTSSVLFIAMLVQLAIGSQPLPQLFADESIRAESVLLRIIDQAEIPARAAGPLVGIHFREGQTIQSGEVVAQVDDLDAKLLEDRALADLALAEDRAQSDVAVRAAKAALDFANAEHQRLKDAAKANPRSVSESELDAAKQGVKQAELDVEEANEERRSLNLMKLLKQNDVKLSQRNVELCKIRAPQQGVVKQIHKKLGEWVEPGDAILRLVRLDRLRAEGFIRASQATRNLQGAMAVVVATPSPAEPTGKSTRYSGTVVFVDSEVDPVNSQVRVWVEIDNPNGSLRPGMSVEMTIHPGAANPPNAVSRRNAP